MHHCCRRAPREPGGGAKIAEGLVGAPDERDRLSLARSLGISEKRLLGWEPEERHEHYDAEGNLTGFTIVTREVEWDDRQRARMEALSIYERGVCSCGFHESLTNDKANAFTFEVKTCPVCRGAAKFDRIQQHSDEQSDKTLGDNPPPGLSRSADGRRTFIRQMSPLEVAAMQRPSVAEKAPSK